MDQEYRINLNPSREELETYELEDKNLVDIRVQLPDGKIVRQPRCRVELTLSPDAMIGLGTELIRKGLRLRALDESLYKYEIEHLSPIDKHTITINMGIYLMPESCELIIAAEDFGKVENNIQKIK